MDRRFAVQVVLCGGLAFLCSFVDRLAWPPVIPLAAKELELTAAQAGSFMSAFFLGYLITQLPGGILADRLGTRKVLLASLLLMGIFTLSLAWVPGFRTGLLLRFFAGIGSGAVLAASVKGVYDYFEASRRATAMGLFMASGPLGLLLANLAAPQIAADFGWRTSFLAAGSLTFFSLAAAWLLLPRPANGKATGSDSKGAGLGELLSNRELMLTAAAGFFAMWGTWGTLTWANAYMHQGLGLSLSQSGKIMAMFGIGALAGQPAAGWLSDCYPRRRRQAAILILAFFGMMLLWFGYNKDSALLPVIAPLLGAGAFIFGPVLNTFISELVASDKVGTAIGFCNGIWQLGSLVSPLAAGILLDRTGSYLWAFAMLAAGPLLAVLLLAIMHRSGNRSVRAG